MRPSRFFLVPEPELAIDKKSIVVVFTLQEEDVTKIEKKDFEQIKLEDLKKETGFNTLLTFLDIHLAKDNLPDSLKKFEEFEDLNKLFVFKRLFIPFDFHLYGEVTIASERLQFLPRLGGTHGR